MSALLSSPSVVIAEDAALSGAVYLGAGLPVAIEMPAAWTAAALTFQGSVDGVVFANVYDDGGTEYAASVAASQHIALDHNAFIGCAFVKVRSGTAGTPVNQVAARTLKLVIRRDIQSIL